MLLGELSHRVDVVISIRQLCDSLDSNEVVILANNNNTINNNGSPTKAGSSRGFAADFSDAAQAANAGVQQFISGDISDICKSVVEPFCARLLAFSTAGNFPRIIASTMAALARAQSKHAMNSSHHNQNSSSTSTRSSFISIQPAAFLCNCIGKLYIF